MRKFTLALLLGLCAIGLLSLIFLCSMPQTSGSPGFGDTSRSPISINGNTQFNSDNGVNGGGNGTASNPYIIENWVISASSANGISIQNTTAYFVVRNCLVENGGSTYKGIYLSNVTHGRIENNTCSNNSYGMYLYSSYDNLTGNTCENNSYGIYLSSSSYDNLTSNTCENNNSYGIYLGSSSYDNLTSNTCENNSYGIYLESSAYNNLTSNICENNSYGIYIYASSYDNLTSNTCENNSYNFGVVGTSISKFDHNIDNSNLVNGKPIYYLKDNSNLVIGSSLDIGYLGLVRCNDIRVENLLLENNSNGILLAFTENSRIENCVLSNNFYGISIYSSSHDNLTGNICENSSFGIYLESSSYNNLTGNTCENNNDTGIYLASPSYDNLTGNTCSNNYNGIFLDYSSYDNLTNNTCENNSYYGIYLYYSSYDNLTSNTCENNSFGIYLYSSSYNNLTSNTCSNNSYNFGVEGEDFDISYFDHNIDNSNLVNGKPIYYLKDNSNLVIGSSLDIGYLGLVRCNDIRVENLVLENNVQGILFASTENSRIENCVLSNNFYGISLYSSSYDNLTSNTCSKNPYGIYLYSSCNYNNLTSNTCENNNSYGIYLTSSSNILTGNLISNNIYDIYNTGTTNTYSSNQFNNNMVSKMWTFTENTRTDNVGDNVSFSVSAFNLDGTNLSGGTTVTTSPSETSSSYSDNGSGTVTGWFIPTKSGTYSLNFTVTDSNSNTTKRRILFFVGNTTSSTTTYYFRGISPTHGPHGNGSDSKILLLTAPTTIETWNCISWIQNSPDEIPDFPLVNLSSINTYTWYKQSASSGAYIGVERYVTYGFDIDRSLSVGAVSDYTLINENFTGLNWAMDYPQNWYWLSLKLSGSNVYWTTFPSGHPASEASYADFIYSYTTTPAIKSISNLDIVLLSATAPVDDNENATIVLDGIGSTNIVLDNYHRPFIGYTTTINSDNTATLHATGLTDNTTINSVAMDITPSSGSIDVSIDTWNTSGTYYKKWTENGSSPDITASHTIGDLKANAHYTVKVDGTILNTYQSNSSGQITFTYNGGDSTKTFEIEHIPPNKPDTLRVEGQTSPQLLTTFTPEFSFRYTDNDNADSSMVQIQVGTSAGDNSMWDSQQVKNVENGATISITYVGTALQRDIQYYWHARVRDNENSWSEWSDNENFKLSPSSTVTVGDRTIELTLLEAGDTPVIPTSNFTIRLTIRTSVDTLLIYYARTEGTPQIPAESVAQFYFDISTNDPDAIGDVTITFNIPRSWVTANNMIPSTLVAWRNSTGTWQTLPSRLVGQDSLYYYLEATTSGFSLFGVSGQKEVIAPTEQQPSSSQIPISDQQTQQAIFIVALGILIISAMFFASTFIRHKRR